MVVALLSVQHRNSSPASTPLLLILENISHFLNAVHQRSHRSSLLVLSIAIQSLSEIMPSPVPGTMKSVKVEDARAKRIAEHNAKLVK